MYATRSTDCRRSRAILPTRSDETWYADSSRSSRSMSATTPCRRSTGTFRLAHARMRPRSSFSGWKSSVDPSRLTTVIGICSIFS